MAFCTDIKFHGYFIGVLAGLLEVISLSISAYTQLVVDDPDHSELPEDLLDLVSTSAVDYAGDVVILTATVMLIYGTYKENRYCIIPFTVAICFDWVSYLVHNTDQGMPYHVWLLTTALFAYVFVAMLCLFILLGTEIKTTKANDPFVKFQSELLV